MASKLIFNNANGLPGKISLVNPDSNNETKELDISKLTTYVDTVDDLASLTSAVGTVIVSDKDRGGIFNAIASTTANDGTIFDGSGCSWERQYEGAVNVKWFGAIEGNVSLEFNDYVQASIQVSNEIIIEGLYYTQSGVSFPSDTKIISSGNHFWQEPSQKDLSSGTAIVYNGVGGTNSYVAKLSAVAVGTKPTYQADGSQNNYNVKMDGITFDGGDIAEFGLYGARCGLGTNLDNITTTGTLKHGVWFGEFWSAKLGTVVSLYNNGCGVTLGEDTFSWGSNTVNAIDSDFILTFKNGLDNDYNYSTSINAGYGIGIFVSRACKFGTIIAELNSGVGIYIDTKSGPNSIENVYLEDNALNSLDAEFRAYNIVINPSTDGCLGFSINNIYNKPSSGTYPTDGVHPTIRITGTSTNTTYPSNVVKNTFGGIRIYADWSNYVLLSTHSSTQNNIDGAYPQGDVQPELENATISTLYVRNSGTGGGQSTSSALADLNTAFKVASVLPNVSVIDIKGSLFGASELNTQLNRSITVEGDAGTQIVSLEVNNSKNSLVSFKNIASLGLVKLFTSTVKFNGTTFVFTHDGGATGAGIQMSDSSVSFINSPVDCSGMLTSQRGLEINNNSTVVMDNSQISNYSAGLAVLLRDNGSELTTDQALTSSDVLIASGEGRVFTPTSLILSGATLV